MFNLAHSATSPYLEEGGEERGGDAGASLLRGSLEGLHPRDTPPGLHLRAHPTLGPPLVRVHDTRVRST